MATLSAEQLARLQRTLRRRLRVASRPELLDIGFGHTGSPGPPTDTGRLACIVFTIESEPPRGGRSDIPAEVEVRLREGKKFRTLRLPTRTISVDGLEPSTVQAEFRGTRFSASAAVSWRRAGVRRREWGVLTVGHPFPSLQRLSAWQRLVTIRAKPPFHGTLFARSRRGGRFDAALLRVAYDELLQAEILPAAGRVAYRAARSLEQLARDMGREGRLQRAGDQIVPLVVQAILPSMTIPGVGRLHNVVAASAPRTRTFRPGSSGSGWYIAGQPACLQVAAVAPGYKLGFGQALTSLLVWTEKILRRRDPELVPGSLRLAPIGTAS